MRRAVRGLALALVALRVAVSAARADDTAPPAPAPFSTTVTGALPSPAAPREDKTAAASVLIPSDSPRAFDDLGTLLLQVPGVMVVRTGSTMEFATLTLRGSNPDEVLVYVDGVLMNVAEGGGVDISTLPLGDVERVEVYRGTTPLAFGESALGGVVSITTRTPSAARAEARAGVGSYGTAFGDLAAGGRLGRLKLYAGVHLYTSKGDYPFLFQAGTATVGTDDVVRPRGNNDLDEGNAVLRASLTLTGRRTLTLAALGFGRDQGLSGNGNTPYKFPRFHSARGIGYLRYESRDDLGPGGRLAAEAFSSVEWDRLIDRDAEILRMGALVTHATTLSSGVTGNASRPLGEWGRAAVVLEGRRETYEPVNELFPAMTPGVGSRTIGVAGGELDVRVRPLDLDVVPSARVELMSDAVSGISATTGRAQPTAPAVFRALPVYRLGMLRPLGESATFKANIGRYEQAPSFLELYGNGNAFLLGNPALRPERGTNADLALWIDRASSRVAVASRTTLFGTVADDLIDWLRSSNGPSRSENVDSARVYGVEQELTAAVGRHFRFTGQGTVTVALDESNTVAYQGKQLPYHPRYTAYARPEVAHLALPAGLALGFYADAALFVQEWADPTNVERVPNHAIIGAGARLSIPRARLRATVSALNVTDERTWDLVYWPLPGRTFFVALAYESTAGEGPGDGINPAFGNP